MMALITRASVRTPGEFIRDSLGSLLFMEYLFEDTFKREASDLDDLVDGILYLDAKNYMREMEMKKYKEKKEE